ncbi:putative HTH-type transcriptional regulator [Paraconexibacter sp. AEG42_29]|uniref:HTH-type transcriptional regulator n=2 Tax=Paraconexibacter sp. AEG42_29 TaxID=2997339 RepID=A0AAU7B0A4_9ACTN
MLLATACEHGMSVAECLADTGLTADLLADPGAEILASQEEQMIRNIVTRFGQGPEVGLAAGSSYRLPTFGMFGLAIMSAQTPRQTIEVSLRVQDLSATLAHARLSDSADFGYMTLDSSHLTPTIRPFVIDHCLAAIWVPFVSLDGVPRTATIELTRRRPADTTPYRRMFGREPLFDQPADRIGFCHDFLDQRRPQVDPLALRQCEEQCRALIERRRARIGIAGLVREQLVRSFHVWPSMGDVAAALTVSERTLTRRLAAEGTSFRRIEATARRNRAEALLRQPSQTIEQVADALGYATCSAFVRAFRRWHGVPPGAWRHADCLASAASGEAAELQLVRGTPSTGHGSLEGT